LETADGHLHPAIEQLKLLEPESVVVLAGAGISCSAGIPDFRSPGTGLYDNLQKFNLPYPKAVFDLDLFCSDPEPFTVLAKELWPTNFKPTPTHMFVRLLHEKGLLLRHYTQNVDGLDRAAGIPPEKLIEAHGSFGAGHCVDCRAVYSAEFIRKTLFNDEVVHCCKCSGLVKPDIVFFGEQLPASFLEHAGPDLGKARMVLCMGTSLQVMPVASLIAKSRTKNHKRILINRELPKAFGRNDGDLVLLGECDAQVWELTKKLGWQADLARLINLVESNKFEPAEVEKASRMWTTDL